MSYKLATGKWLPTGHEGPIVIAAAIVLSTPVRRRGDRLARLCTAAGSYSMGLGRTSIVVGILSGVWRLLLFLLPGADKYGQSFAFYVVAFSIAISWLYGNIQGSLLVDHADASRCSIKRSGIISDIVRPGEKPLALGTSFAYVLTVAWNVCRSRLFSLRACRTCRSFPHLPRAARDEPDVLTPLAKSAFPISE